MQFLTGSEKIKTLRKRFKMTQDDFASENFTRGYLGLLENGRRNITEDAAKIITERFREKAKELGVDIEIDDRYFLRTIEEEAEKYCMDKLVTDLTYEELEDIIKIGEQYNLQNVKAETYKVQGDKYYNEIKYLEAYKNYFYSLDSLTDGVHLKERCYLYNRLGMCKYILLDFDEAIVYFNKAIINSEIAKQTLTLQNALYNSALCYQSLSNLEESLNCIEKFLVMCDKEKELERYIYASSFKASCYKEKGDLNTAIEIYKELILLINNTDEKVAAYLYNNLGSLYVKKNNLTEALEYYNKSQQIRARVDKKNLSHTLIEKSSVYIAKEFYDEALLIVSLGLENARENNDYEYTLKAYKIMEEVYTKLEKVDKIKETIKELLVFLDETDNKLIRISYYNKLQKLYFEDKEYEKAYECQKEIQRMFN
ncbi:helix-turn-helix transcriptional regulator [Clostridium tunisiense]|uniref:helix-turn-helix transcriptional regulator n=1 Tax=Clostridium tunisiense TaxID=219748 RepID=UPI0002F93EF5|nr:helix-turn-helix transcriptional regulator [Clostridium tunisiense]